MVSLFHGHDEQIAADVSEGSQGGSCVNVSQPGSGGNRHFLLNLHQNEDKTVNHVHEFRDQRRQMALLQYADDFIDRSGKGHEVHAADSGKYLAEQTEGFPQSAPGGVNVKKVQVEAVLSGWRKRKSQSNGQNGDYGKRQRNRQ